LVLGITIGYSLVNLVGDCELGGQTLNVVPEFPDQVDPSLWDTLELVK